MNMNKAILAGNLTRDPELKSLPSGQKVASFSIATNRYWRDKQSGEQKQSTDFHNIVLFGPQGENAAKYLVRGQSCLVEGRIQTRSWDDTATGQKKYRTEIVADKVQFGSKVSGAGGNVGGGNSTASTPAPASKPVSVIEYPDDDINPDDIPF
jgi:single-strand DNA-binding protein